MSTTFTYQGTEYSVPNEIMNIKTTGIAKNERQYILTQLIEHDILLTEHIVRKAHATFLHNTFDSFVQNFHNYGLFEQIEPNHISQTDRDELEDAFMTSAKFGGRVPRILDQLTQVYTYLKQNNIDISAEEIVRKFDYQAVRAMKEAKIPVIYIGLLTQFYSPQKCISLINNMDLAYDVVDLLSQSMQENTLTRNAADWLMEHQATNKKLLKKVYKSGHYIDIKDKTVDAVMQELSNPKAHKTRLKTEKLYAGYFSHNNVVCDLQGVGDVVVDDYYQAYIMQPDDERAYILGDETHCCQRLGDEGESAMMYGLVHDKAGFWVLEDKKTHDIKAQAEIWEENEDTLVFDNIEFEANANIVMYKDAIKEWLLRTPYANVKMGNEWSEISNESFEMCPAPQPPVDAKDLYIISHEKKSQARIFDTVEEAQDYINQGGNYYDYVYCDCDRYCVWLKKDHELQPYFETTLEDIYKATAKYDHVAIRETPVLVDYINYLVDHDYVSQKEMRKYLSMDETHPVIIVNGQQVHHNYDSDTNERYDVYVELDDTDRMDESHETDEHLDELPF